MTEFELIIFDCDGVLIDSEALSEQAWRALFAELQLADKTTGLYQKYFGNSAGEQQMLIDLEHNLSIRLPEDLMRRKDQRMRALVAERLQPVAGIAALLRSLTIPCCVASGSSLGWIEQTLRQTDLWQYVPHSFSAKQVANGKPAPDIFLYAAQQLKVAPAACAVVEDSVAGVTAGKAAGMTVFGLTAGKHCDAAHADRLRLAGADTVFASAAALASVLTPQSPALVAAHA